MNTLFAIFSAIVLLVVSSIFGFMSMPTEMGLAILAGALGTAFSNIDKISEFSGAGFSAKMKDQLQSVIDKETEPDMEQEPDELPQEIVDLKEKDEHVEDALLALTDSKYTWRSINGVANSTSQTPREALDTFELLVNAGLAKSGKSKTGSSIWTPTVRGSVVGAYIKLLREKHNA